MQTIKKILFLLIALISISCNSSHTVKDGAEDVTTINGASPTSSMIPVDTVKTFTLDDIPIYGNFDDLKYIFQQESDTTYVINFWATWCKPCVEELPFFEVLHEEYGGEKMRVILVSLDFPNKLETKLIPFMNEHQLSSEVMVLTDDRYNEWIDWVDSDWDGGIPVTMIYNQKDKKFYRGAFADEGELSVLVGDFLKK
jgi:thiol-disulfide isomerase/thioredoxin